MSPEIPLLPIENQLTRKKAVALYVLRLDAIDHYAGGNKYFKLKYNLEGVKHSGHDRLLTFGGAWSNHLAAVAAILGPKPQVMIRQAIAVVRGEEPKSYSDTLKFCKEQGMQLHFVSREVYRRKNESDFIGELKQKFGDFYLLPEGGSNTLAVKGCREIVDLIDIDFDLICCPVGSGGTLAGISAGLKAHQRALGFAAIKNGDYLKDIVTNLLPPLSLCGISPIGEKKLPFDLITKYHFGGFAKVTPELLSFKKEFEKQNGFELDFVYTSKMFYGIFHLMEKDHFRPGARIVAVHTGGLQGNPGFTGS